MIEARNSGRSKCRNSRGRASLAEITNRRFRPDLLASGPNLPRSVLVDLGCACGDHNRSPPDRSVEIGEDGYRWMRQFVDAGPADDHPVDQQDESDEKPDREHVMFVGPRVHDIDCSSLGRTLATAIK